MFEGYQSLILSIHLQLLHEETFLLPLLLHPESASCSNSNKGKSLNSHQVNKKIQKKNIKQNKEREKAEEKQDA